MAVTSAMIFRSYNFVLCAMNRDHVKLFTQQQENPDSDDRTLEHTEADFSFLISNSILIIQF